MSNDRVTPGSQTSLREANRARIVDAVKRNGGLTQVELVGSTGLSPATVSNIVKELTVAGVVTTSPTSRSGRRAQQVTLARQVGLAAGVQFGHRHLKVILGDFARNIVAEQHMPLPQDHRADTGLDRAALLISDLLDSVGAELPELAGVGVALPAPVDVASGTISMPGVLRGWDDVPIADVMSRRLGRPVYVDNDANLAALAEYRYGAARGVEQCAFVRVSYGAGAGLIVNGELHRGYAGTAGEIGHIRVNDNGPICRCGNRGCLDTIVGSAALIELLRGSHGNVTLRDIVTLAIDGDAGCRRVIADAGMHIGLASANLVSVFNPQRIVIGGEVSTAGDILVDPLRDAIERAVPPNTVGPLEIVLAEFGEDAEAMGALALALDRTDVATDSETMAARASA